MGQNDAERPKRRLVARKAPDSHEVAPLRRKPHGKDLEKQSGENWTPARAQSGGEGDEQSGENRLTARTQSGHEDEEQPVVGQTVYRTYNIQEGVGCRMPEWGQMVKRGAEQPGECFVARRAPNSHEGTK